jgi:galactose oxidase
VAFDRKIGENQIDVDNIQGDVLNGLQKDFELFVGFTIVDVSLFRVFLSGLAPRITTLRTTLEREFILDMRRAAASTEVFTFIGTNIAFTVFGFRALGLPDIDKMKDKAFLAGLPARSASLNDSKTGIGAPENWVIGGAGQDLHGMVIITSPDRESAYQQFDRIQVLAGESWRVFQPLEGKTREDNRGHEHFGFLDGVSQPGVRGQIDAAFPSHKFLTPSQNPNDPGQGKPGQDLLWPGEFVFGYPGQDPDDLNRPGQVVDGGLPWLKNGSFMVFRRLNQFVPEFEAFCEEQEQATTLDTDAGLVAARMVGRWPSGAPLVKSPLDDNAALAKDDLLINDFEFSQDKAGRRCPFAAHIRKSYPRDDITPAGIEHSKGKTDFDQREASESTTQTHRIIRAGIPFGDEVSDDERKTKKTGQARGLMFVCYQTSIEGQFEFIQKAWVNNRAFPPAGGPDGSEDPIIGQSADPSRVRHFIGAKPNYPNGPRGDPISLSADFVVPTGGGYFFVPSVDALSTVFAQEGNSTAPERIGRWDPVIQLPNVPVHTHLLPSGKVMFWGRRLDLEGSMDQHVCAPHLLDPATGETKPARRPRMPDGKDVNLFCSSHTLLADGRLFVAGGHWKDGEGVNQACVYDWRADSWTALPPMNNGRWYPTATLLANGDVLVTSGSFLGATQTENNPTPQIWNGSWRGLNGKVLSLYPRQHVLSDSRVFVAGTNPISEMLDLAGDGAWSDAPSRAHGDRQYAPSVTYAPGKIIFIGGGNDAGTNIPTAAAEVIDFNQQSPAWRSTTAMWRRRRQHNATLLPDGTILVTGGTQGGGGIDNGFNDLTSGEPVHEAELWDPRTERWTLLTAEDEDRCYHSTAVLLPDGRVLSAGGGEYNPGNQPIQKKDVHTTAQIFCPPYLFRGARPVIEAARDKADYNSTITIRFSGPAPARVTAVKLGSVTHSLDANQRFIELAFAIDEDAVTATIPASREDYPPGFYMLFLLSGNGVPSVARMVQIGDAVQADRTPKAEVEAKDQPLHLAEGLTARDKDVEATSKGTRVVIGLTSRCPYGLANCWGGAYQTLQALKGVAVVKAVANAQDSTGELFLDGHGLPDLDDWDKTFRAMAKGSYDFRGVEVTVSGTVRSLGERLVLAGPASLWSVPLSPLEQTDKVQWDWEEKAPAKATADESGVYTALVERLAGGQAELEITGPLRRHGDAWHLHVRMFA